MSDVAPKVRLSLAAGRAIDGFPQSVRQIALAVLATQRADPRSIVGRWPWRFSRRPTRRDRRRVLRTRDRRRRRDPHRRRDRRRSRRRSFGT